MSRKPGRRRSGLRRVLLVLSCLCGPAAALDREALLAELDAIRSGADIAGMALVVVDSESVLLATGLGVADRGTARPMDETTLIRIGSITKSFTGLTLALMDEAGVIDLDRPIVDLVDPVPLDNPWRDSHPVTLAMLLEHTAGLGDMTRREFDHNTPLELAEALAVDPTSRRLSWPPGLHSSYSNSGAGVAAHVFQEATGRDFEQTVAAVLFRPLGMGSATFRRTETVRAQLATGYDSDGRTPIPYWHTLYRPFGGINVRTIEMAPFLRLLLGRGEIDGRRLVPGRVITRFEQPATTLAARSGLEFGYGLGNYASVHGGFVFHGHGGDADGYLSHYGYSRDLDRGYFLVITAFQNRSLRRLRSVVLDALVADHSPRFTPGVPQPASRLRELTGRYRSVTRRFAGAEADSLEVVYLEDSGRLYLDRGRRRQHLIPLSARHFRRPFEPVATTAFVEDRGSLFLQGPFGNYRRVQAAGPASASSGAASAAGSGSVPGSPP